MYPRSNNQLLDWLCICGVFLYLTQVWREQSVWRHLNCGISTWPVGGQSSLCCSRHQPAVWPSLLPRVLTQTQGGGEEVPSLEWWIRPGLCWDVSLCSGVSEMYWKCPSLYTDSHEQWQLPDLHSLTKILNYTDIKVLISRYFTLFLLYWCYSYVNTSQFQLGPGFCHLILNPQELVPCVHIFRNRPMQMTVLKLHRCLAE